MLWFGAALQRSQKLRLQTEQRRIGRVDKRSASANVGLVDALRLSTLPVSSRDFRVFRG